MKTFASVKSFTDTLSKNEPRVDVAVLHARMVASSYKLSPEGCEMCLQVSLLSTTLLATLLLAQLRKATEVTREPSHL